MLCLNVLTVSFMNLENYKVTEMHKSDLFLSHLPVKWLSTLYFTKSS